MRELTTTQVKTLNIILVKKMAIAIFFLFLNNITDHFLFNFYIYMFESIRKVYYNKD